MSGDPEAIGEAPSSYALSATDGFSSVVFVQGAVPFSMSSKQFESGSRRRDGRRTGSRAGPARRLPARRRPNFARGGRACQARGPTSRRTRTTYHRLRPSAGHPSAPPTVAPSRADAARDRPARRSRHRSAARHAVPPPTRRSSRAPRHDSRLAAWTRNIFRRQPACASSARAGLALRAVPSRNNGRSGVLPHLAPMAADLAEGACVGAIWRARASLTETEDGSTARFVTLQT